jgi:antirestriction protein ArdC
MSRSIARARAGRERTSLYQEITDKIITELKAGRVPWVQPWGTVAAKALLTMPKNAATHRHYSGINVLILWGAVIDRGFSTQNWLAFQQALRLGGNVRNGERGTTVLYADHLCPMRNVGELSAMDANRTRSHSSNDLRCSTPINAKTSLERWRALHHRMQKGSWWRKRRR